MHMHVGDHQSTLTANFFLEYYSHLFYLALLWLLSHVLILKAIDFN